MGAAWWGIKDAIFLPHGADSHTRHLLAYGCLGALLFGTIVHPINTIHGFVAGVAYASLMLTINRKSYPKNWELRIKSTNP